MKSLSRIDVELLVGVALAIYCWLWTCWLIANIGEVAVPNFRYDFMIEVIGSVVVGSFGFALVLWQGDRIAQVFAERRRIREWADVTRLCCDRVRYALMQNLIGTIVRTTTQPKMRPDHDLPDPIAGHFEWWAGRLREVLVKLETVEASSSLADSLSESERELAWAPSNWRFNPARAGETEPLPGLTIETARRVDRAIGTFHLALPEDLRRALLHASVELEYFNEQSRIPENPQQELGVAKQSLRNAIRLLRALAELSGRSCTGTKNSSHPKRGRPSSILEGG